MNNIQDVLLSKFSQNFQTTQEDFLNLRSNSKPDILVSISSSLQLEIWEFFLIIAGFFFLVGLLIVIMNKFCQEKPIDDQVNMISSNLVSRPMFLRGLSPENL